MSSPLLSMMVKTSSCGEAFLCNESGRWPEVLQKPDNPKYRVILEEESLETAKYLSWLAEVHFPVGKWTQNSVLSPPQLKCTEENWVQALKYNLFHLQMLHDFMLVDDKKIHKNVLKFVNIMWKIKKNFKGHENFYKALGISEIQSRRDKLPYTV